ncbi:MAG: YdcF family protein [Burkholderiales bacterium]
MLAGNLGECLLPIPIYLVAGLAVLCVLAFRNRQWRLRRWRYAVLALLLWSYCFSTPAIANAWIDHLESRYERVTNVASGVHDTLIVVLSSGFAIKIADHDAMKLDAPGWERTYAGIQLWRKAGGQLLFVGEPSPDGKQSIAELMAEVARESGVPTTAIQVETRSRNTFENLQFSKAIIAAHGENAWLVTSAIHMPRAMAVARNLGLRIRPYPCDYRATQLRHWYAWLPNADGPAMHAEAFHEVVGLAYYRIRGRASR